MQRLRSRRRVNLQIIQGDSAAQDGAEHGWLTSIWDAVQRETMINRRYPQEAGKGKEGAEI